MTMLLNGVDVPKLMTRIESVRRNPAEGAFTFHVTSEWDGGLKGHQSVHDITIGAETQHHGGPFETHTDMPGCLGGEDTSGCPIEMLLSALSACLMTGYVAHAAAMNIKLQGLRVDVRGEGDLAGFFGIGMARAGLTNIAVQTTMRSTAPAEKLKDLHKFVTAHSPVWDTLTNRVQVEAKFVSDTEQYGSISL